MVAIIFYYVRLLLSSAVVYLVMTILEDSEKRKTINGLSSNRCHFVIHTLNELLALFLLLLMPDHDFP